MNDLKEFRERLGISQEDVASLFNVSRSYMAMMESGDRPSSGKKILLMTEAIRLLDTLEEPILPVMTPSDEPPAFIPKELERLNARRKALEKEWKLITDKYCLLERRRMYGERIIQSGNFPERKVSSVLTKWNGLWSIDMPICDASVQKNIWDELDYIDSQIQHLTDWNGNVAE